jgi:hypothetical protein
MEAVFRSLWRRLASPKPYNPYPKGRQLTCKELRYSVRLCRSSRRKGMVWKTLWNLVNCPCMEQRQGLCLRCCSIHSVS